MPFIDGNLISLIYLFAILNNNGSLEAVKFGSVLKILSPEILTPRALKTRCSEIGNSNGARMILSSKKNIMLGRKGGSINMPLNLCFF